MRQHAYRWRGWWMAAALILLSACAGESPPRVEVKVLSTIGAGVGDLAFVDEVVKGVALAKLQADFFLEFAEPQTFEEADALFHAWLREQQRHDSVLIITVGAEYINLVESNSGYAKYLKGWVSKRVDLKGIDKDTGGLKAV